MPNPVRDMTTAIASGDAEAFARFYREHFDFMYAEARQLTRLDERFCLDVVQNAFMRIIRGMKPMESEASLRRWLSVVVKSCCYDELRKMKRARQREWQAPSRDVAVTDQDHDERLQWLRAQLLDLPPDQSHLLALRFRLGWTLERIGRSLGLKPGAVDGRISRTLSFLRRRAMEDAHE